MRNSSKDNEIPPKEGKVGGRGVGSLAGAGLLPHCLAGVSGISGGALDTTRITMLKCKSGSPPSPVDVGVGVLAGWGVLLGPWARGGALGGVPGLTYSTPGAPPARQPQMFPDTTQGPLGAESLPHEISLASPTPRDCRAIVICSTRSQDAAQLNTHTGAGGGAVDPARSYCLALWGFILVSSEQGSDSTDFPND